MAGRNSGTMNVVKNSLTDAAMKECINSGMDAVNTALTSGVYRVNPVKGMENIYDPCQKCPRWPGERKLTKYCNCTVNGNRAVVKEVWDSFSKEKKITLLKKWGYSDEQLQYFI